MKDKINVAELLKDCPIGMELDSTLFEGLEFDAIVDNDYLPIRCRIKNPNGGYTVYNFTKYGCWLDATFAKCVIFPKGKTTWEGFVPPYQFKDGDILVVADTIYIYNGVEELSPYPSHYVYVIADKNGFFAKNTSTKSYGARFASEEEKQKLFDAIKANGYRWNSETKTLEVIKLKFHEGQWITKGYVGGQITSIDYNYSCYRIADFMGGIDTSIPFAVEDNYRLWTIQDAKDGDVLACNEEILLFKSYSVRDCISAYCWYNGQTNHFHSKEVDDAPLTTRNKIYPATKEQCYLLFQKMKEAGYKWNSETKTLKKLLKFKVGDRVKNILTHVLGIIVEVTDKGYHIEYLKAGGFCYINFELEKDYELALNKFDITTLKPFDKVLVRDTKEQVWVADLFSHMVNRPLGGYTFACVGHYPSQCIPYEGNEHLLGTTNDCYDFYKTWK